MCMCQPSEAGQLNPKPRLWDPTNGTPPPLVQLQRRPVMSMIQQFWGLFIVTPTYRTKCTWAGSIKIKMLVPEEERRDGLTAREK